ncbi:MAG: chemotaxis protein CheR [Magnetospirillum sp.]|nr:chemotaxis protein CheR [Magnetospirillum sp.]
MNAIVEGLQTLRPADFRRLATFIECTAGIKMPASKRVMVEGRLRRRLRALGMSTFREYCDFLFEDGGLVDEEIALIDAVTTNKTEFFREADHFRFLGNEVLPGLAAAGVGLTRPAKIWCTAASTGAEPYTIAMVAAEFGRSVAGWRAAIFATDICTEALQKAVMAIYPEDMAAPVPPGLRGRYFLRAKDSARGEIRVVPPLRRMVTFGRLNLMDEVYGVDGDLDVIFCRNQLIYFEKPVQATVLRRLCGHLRPGGHLFLGHTETVAGIDLPLAPVAGAVFVRR